MTVADVNRRRNVDRLVREPGRSIGCWHSLGTPTCWTRRWLC